MVDPHNKDPQGTSPPSVLSRLNFGASDPAILVLQTPTEALAVLFEDERTQWKASEGHRDHVKRERPSGPLALAECSHRSNPRQTMNREKYSFVAVLSQHVLGAVVMKQYVTDTKELSHLLYS